ncbi:hypothetical protein NQD34_001049 [Periophthalmus magnuspinnatus]|nr:hypothetical protein NQD34_001049 [Periophthalmus magnuspinnatus]
MDLYRGKLCVFLFLPLSIGGSNVFLDKYIRTEEDSTPICIDEMIVSIHCNVKNKENELPVCSLLYIPGKVNRTQCSPRISLMTQNQTVFLHLVNLTSADSGVYSCECTGKAGVSKVHLNVYVGANKQFTSEHNTVNLTFLYSIIIIPIIIFGVILGCVYKTLQVSYEYAVQFKNKCLSLL